VGSFLTSGHHHWPFWRRLTHDLNHHIFDITPDFCDIDQGDAQQTGGEPAGGGKAEAAALTRGQRNNTTLVVMEAINLSSKKVGEPWTTWRD